MLEHLLDLIELKSCLASKDLCHKVFQKMTHFQSHPVGLIFLHRRDTKLVIIDIPCGTERGYSHDGCCVTAADPFTSPVQPFLTGKVFCLHQYQRTVPSLFKYHAGHIYAPLLALCVKFTVRMMVQFF